MAAAVVLSSAIGLSCLAILTPLGSSTVVAAKPSGPPGQTKGSPTPPPTPVPTPIPTGTPPATPPVTATPTSTPTPTMTPTTPPTTQPTPAATATAPYSTMPGTTAPGSTAPPTAGSSTVAPLPGSNLQPPPSALPNPRPTSSPSERRTAAASASLALAAATGDEGGGGRSGPSPILLLGGLLAGLAVLRLLPIALRRRSAEQAPVRSAAAGSVGSAGAVGTAGSARIIPGDPLVDAIRARHTRSSSAALAGSGTVDVGGGATGAESPRAPLWVRRLDAAIHVAPMPAPASAAGRGAERGREESPAESDPIPSKRSDDHLSRGGPTMAAGVSTSASFVRPVNKAG